VAEVTTQDVDIVTKRIGNGRMRIDASICGRWICQVELDQVTDPNDVLGALNCVMTGLAKAFEVDLSKWQGDAELLFSGEAQ